MKPKEEVGERIYDFKQAVKSVINHLHPQTLGPCHYCEWPITNSFQSCQGRDLVAVCKLCDKLRDTPFTRRWEDEEPACAI